MFEFSAAASEEVALYGVFVLSLVLTGASIVGVFIYIPIVSEYAFWVAVVAYVMLAGAKQHWHWR